MWGLSANGYRKSYGIVTAMFGITIFACYVFKMILSQLNKKLERGELDWDATEDVANRTAEMEGTTVDEALSMRVSNALRFLNTENHSGIPASFSNITDTQYRRVSAIWCE